MNKDFLAISLAGLWITFFEFLRNELILKEIWVNHYSSLGLIFETLPLNGILWLFWSFILAILIYKLNEKFSFEETAVISWLFAFFMMWVVTFNLQVLPFNLILFAIPLSVIEIIIAILIIKKFI
jgi:hypothetical protein